MKKNTIGIDISDFSIEAVVLGKKKGHLAVEAYARFRLSPDVVEDGRIISSERLKDALIKLVQNGQPKILTDYKKVFFSVPESRVFSKVFSLPKNLKDREFREAINHKAEEAIPEIAENLVPEFKILSSNGENQDIFYAAADRTVVNDFVNVFGSLGWEISGIVPEAVSSFAGLADKYKDKVTLLLDLGARTTIVSVFDKNGIHDSINIRIGGNNITNALMQKLGLTYADAEEAKKQIGLMPDHNGEVMLVTQGQLQPLTDELKNFISYYEVSKQKIEQLVLIGGLAQMKGIDKYFGDNLSRPAIVGEAFIDNHLMPEGMASVKYINALGLARLAYQKPDIDFYSGLSRDKKKIAKEPDPQDRDTAKDETVSDSSVKRPLPFKKSQLLILLLIIILGVLLFIFRNNFYQLFNKPSVNTVGPTNTNLGADNIPDKSFVQNFLVTNNSKASQTAILGEEFEVDLSKGLPKTTEAFAESQTKLLSQLDEYALNAVNSTYSKDGYYIIPKVVSSEIIKSIPAEDKFTVGSSLSINVKYKFLALAKDKLQTFLQTQGRILSQADMDSLIYTVLNQSADQNGVVFDVQVELK